MEEQFICAIAKCIKTIRPEELEVSLSTSLYLDLGLDSLEMISLIFEIEDMFNINLSENVWTSVDTVGDIYSIFCTKGKLNNEILQ